MRRIGSPREGLGRRFRLLVAEFGELRVVDAGVAAGGREMQVELALPVSQQDHRGVRRWKWGGAGARRAGGRRLGEAPIAKGCRAGKSGGQGRARLRARRFTS